MTNTGVSAEARGFRTVVRLLSVATGMVAALGFRNRRTGDHEKTGSSYSPVLLFNQQRDDNPFTAPGTLGDLICPQALQPEGYGSTLTGSPCASSVGPLTTTRSPRFTPATTVMTLPKTCPICTGRTRATSRAFSRSTTTTAN